MIIYNDLAEPGKKFVRILAILLAAGLVLSSFAFAYWYFVSGWEITTDSEIPRQLNVSGEGKVTVRPDLALFTVGVVSQKNTVSQAQADNTKNSNAIISFLKEQGIEEKDIKTIVYSINPVQSFPPPCYSASCLPITPPKIIGYEVHHSLEVKVRDLNKTDVILTGVVNKGANEVGSIQFTVDEIEKVQAEARKKAIEDAKEKAEILAQDLGVRLKRVVSFYESGGMPYPVRLEAMGKGGGGDFGAATPQIASGEQEIRSFVNVVYEFR